MATPEGLWGIEVNVRFGSEADCSKGFAECPLSLDSGRSEQSTIMAERKGFEPSIPRKVQQISNQINPINNIKLHI